MLLQSVSRRARSLGRRWSLLVALLACVVTLGAVAAPSGAERASAPAAAAGSPLTGFTVQLGPEERVFGPSGLTDFPYFSERTPSGKLLGFISNNDSYRVTSNANKTIRAPKIILRRGKPGSFDKCGAWLIGSVYKRGSRWMALYHAEAAGKGDNNRCIFNDDSVVASVGRAVSHDAGRTWKKTGQVLTQDKRLRGPKTEDATMGRLVQYGDYLYFFYGASVYGQGTTRRLHVARSHVDNVGAKGTWRKWHCYKPDAVSPRRCDFGGTGNQGLGGVSSPLATIDPMARVIIPNTYLDHSIALYASGTRGFRLWVSKDAAAEPPIDPSVPPTPDDPTTRAWPGSVPIYAPVSSQGDRQVDNWNRTRRSKQLYGYPSIVGLNGESHTSGQSFYIYYVKLFPGAEFSDRYLMRRKVTLSKDPAALGLNRVALTTYYRKSDGRRRTSTERPIQSTFKPNRQEGYLLGEPAAGYTQVIECARKGNFRLRLNQCATGEKAYRRVGWISASESATAPTAIYRCFNRRKANHFASTDPACLGFGKGTLLGYGLDSIA